MPGSEVQDMEVLNTPYLQPIHHNKAKNNTSTVFFFSEAGGPGVVLRREGSAGSCSSNLIKACMTLLLTTDQSLSRGEKTAPAKEAVGVEQLYQYYQTLSKVFLRSYVGYVLGIRRDVQSPGYIRPTRPPSSSTRCCMGFLVIVGECKA